MTGTDPLRVLWVLGIDRPKADTISLVRWVRAGELAGRLNLSVAFLSEPTSQRVEEFGGTIADALSSAGAEVVHWPRGRRLRPDAIRAAAGFCRSRRIEVIHSSLLRADVFCRLLVRHMGQSDGFAPAWVSTLAGLGQYRRTRLYCFADFWDRRIYRRPDRLVAVSQAVADDWSRRLNRPPDDFTVLPYGVGDPPPQTGSVAEVRTSLSLPADCRLVLTVARIDREKGIETLVEAAGAVLAEANALCPPPRFVVVGDGAWRGRIETLIRRRGLVGRVILVGDRLNVWSFLSAADLFVLPSRMEGCPNALLEAASAGLPIVATAVGGVPELVRNGQEALLIQPGDPKILAAAIGRALSDEPLRRRLGHAARDRVVENFTAAVAARRHIELYDLLRRQRPAGRADNIFTFA